MIIFLTLKLVIIEMLLFIFRFWFSIQQHSFDVVSSATAMVVLE